MSFIDNYGAWEDEEIQECPGCGAGESQRCRCDEIYSDHDDDHGPPDSDYGDSESDHVWADLRRSEAA